MLHKYCFRMSKDVENVKRSIVIAINVVIIVMLKRYFIAKSHFVVDLTFLFDLSKTNFFVSFVNCIYIVFVHIIIDYYFINRKKYFRKILKTCFRMLDMRMKKRQKNFFFAFS